MVNTIKDVFSRSFRKKVFKPFSVYSGSNLINQAIPFLLLPVLTRFLSPADYGIVAIFMAIMAIGNILISAGASDAVARGYFDRDKEGFSFSEYVCNSCIINIVFFVAVTGMLFIFQDYICKVVLFPKWWILLAPLAGICSAISNLSLKLWIFQQKSCRYASFQVSRTLIEFILSLFLVIILGLNWQGRILGINISKLVFLLISMYILFKTNLVKFSIRLDYIKDILKYGLPVVIHSLGFVIIGAIDRLFLTKFIGLSTAGIYSVGYSLAMVIGFVVGAFNLAWNPILFEKLSKITKEIKLKLVQLTYLYFILLFVCAIGLIASAPYILRVFAGKEFYGASSFIFWLSLGYVAHGMYVMVVGYVFYKKKTYFLSIVALVTIILNIILNYIFIKANGAIGAAQATFFTFLIRFILVWYISNKAYPMPWFSFRRLKNQQKRGPSS